RVGRPIARASSLGYACSVMGLHQKVGRKGARPGTRDPLAREMAKLTEAERVKRWLRGMRAADELSQRLRAAGGSKPTETVTPTARRQTAARRKVGARAARRR